MTQPGHQISVRHSYGVTTWYGWACSCGKKSRDTRYGTPGGAERAGEQHAKTKTEQEARAQHLRAQIEATPAWARLP